MNIEFANRLQQLRKEKGYSQDQLADEIGVSRQSISKWERAEASPDSDNLIALAKLYNMSLDELIYNKNPSEEKSSNVKDDVHISFKGIDVKSKEGDHVHVGWDGIHVHDINKNKHVDISNEGVYINGNLNRTKTQIIVRDSINLIVLLLTTITYILIGCLLSKWHPTWIIFFLIPIVSSLVEAIMSRDIEKFAYPVLVAAVYLTLGFLLNLWHPYWFLFLTIPIYYIVISLIKKLTNKNNVEIKIEKDE